MTKVTFLVQSDNVDAAVSTACAIPGVYANKRNRRVLFCSDHAAWLVERNLLHAGVRFKALVDPPEQILATFPSIPELRVGPDFFMAFQRDFVQRFANRAGCYLFHAAGAGKTLTAIAWALLTSGLILVVTRASAKAMWMGEIQRFTTARVLVLPRAVDVLLTNGASLTTRDDVRNCALLTDGGAQRVGAIQTLAALSRSVDTFDVVAAVGAKLVTKTVAVARRKSRYDVKVQETRHASLPRFIVTNWESLQRNLSLLRQLPIHTVIWDEIHKGKQPRRAIALYGENETVTFTSRKNTSSAAVTLARMATRRVGASATPVADRPRDLWAQLDLLEPFQWGAFGGPSARGGGFSGRYCGACATKYTTWDTSGKGRPEMLQELRQRLSFVVHAVPRSVSHAALPPKRRIVTRIDEEDLDAPPPELLAELHTVAREQPARLREVKLALAAARKRSFALDLIAGAVEGGQKVVVFTARVDDCHLLTEAVRRAHGKRKATNDACGPRIWSGTGETPLAERERMRLEYMEAAGPAVFVGTGEAFGEALSFHDTDLLLLVMTPLNARQLIQWEGRVTRLGQKRPVIIHYLIAEGTADVPVADILLSKLPAAEAIVGDGEMGTAARDILYGGREEEIEERLFAALMETPVE
jgi:hypothetical protein